MSMDGVAMWVVAAAITDSDGANPTPVIFGTFNSLAAAQQRVADIQAVVNFIVDNYEDLDELDSNAPFIMREHGIHESDAQTLQNLSVYYGGRR